MWKCIKWKCGDMIMMMMMMAPVVAVYSWWSLVWPSSLSSYLPGGKKRVLFWTVWVMWYDIIHKKKTRLSCYRNSIFRWHKYDQRTIWDKNILILISISYNIWKETYIYIYFIILTFNIMTIITIRKVT